MRELAVLDRGPGKASRGQQGVQTSGKLEGPQGPVGKGHSGKTTASEKALGQEAAWLAGTEWRLEGQALRQVTRDRKSGGRASEPAEGL